MAIKKIYLIRHGQTELNRQGIVQGSGVDSELNELGFKQANAFFEVYRHILFDKVYTSALTRTIQSVQQFIDLGIPHEKLSGLNEISWGKKEGKKVTPEEDEFYHFMLNEWKRGVVNIAIEGGESPLQVLERQKPALAHILSKTEEEKILVCMHGRAMRIFLCLLLNYELKDMDTFLHDNLCLYELSYTGAMFSVDKFCDVEHLLGLGEELHPH